MVEWCGGVVWCFVGGWVGGVWWVAHPSGQKLAKRRIGQKRIGQKRNWPKENWPKENWRKEGLARRGRNRSTHLAVASCASMLDLMF